MKPIINKRKMRNGWIKEGLLSGREGCPVSLSRRDTVRRSRVARKVATIITGGGEGGKLAGTRVVDFAVSESYTREKCIHSDRLIARPPATLHSLHTSRCW